MAVVATRPSAEDRIRAATWFAEHGFGVFSVWSTDPDGSCRCPKKGACDNPGKHPIGRQGFHENTQDPVKIRTLLSAGSEPNYGLVCPEGVFALDVDGEGVARLAELEAQYGPLPATLRTTTAHGQHIFLRWPESLPRPIGQLFGYVTRWGSGPHAGYVIGPRSVHASGAEYAPAGSAAIAEIPEAWVHAVIGAQKPPGPSVTVTGGGYQLPERVGAGQSRYEAILAYTAHLYNTSRLSPTEMWPLVRDVLAPRFAEPLRDDELRSRFDRAVDKMAERLGDRRGGAAPPEPVDPSSFQQPENRGQATLSDLGNVEYVEDLIRPGRIVVWAAEEGSGKSFAVSGELAIRMAAAGGEFAGTWPIRQGGRVLVLSEMHADDDWVREDTILRALGKRRADIDDRYYRLDLMTAAGGRPALTVPEWRAWITEWLRDRDVLLMVVDTATGATQVDPWGREIQAVYSSLRVMLAEYTSLAVVLIVHLKKPQGRDPDRGISDVLGEWGRWCDVVVLQENEGLDLHRAKLTVRKRVRRERRVVVTKKGGLLVDPMDLMPGLEDSKVPQNQILSAIGDNPDISLTALAKLLQVSPPTVKRYVRALGSRLTLTDGPRGSKLVRLADEDDPTLIPNAANVSSDSGDGIPVVGTRNPNPSPTEREGSRDSGRGSDSDDQAPVVLEASADVPWIGRCLWYADHTAKHRRTAEGWTCDACHPPEDLTA